MSVAVMLSVIIITRGKPEELDGAIANMLNQDRPPDEIVVLDNDPQGSGCRAEHIGDPAVRYYRAKEDLGIVEGRNCAAAEAKGDILLFMNDYIRFDKYHVTNLMVNAFRPREIACLAFQVLLNVAGVTKALPMTGIALPLLSQGGSNLLTTCLMAGILLAVSEPPAGGGGRTARRRRKHG